MMKMVKNFRTVGKREEGWEKGGGVVRGEGGLVRGKGGGGKT